MESRNGKENQKSLTLWNKVAYGIGTGGGALFNQIASAFLLQYYTDTAMIAAGAIATMFLISRVFDGVTDLVMGAIVDKTHSKLGKARPWLLASAPLMLLGIVLLMNVPMGLSDGGKLVYAYLTYIFQNCIVYTIYGISNTALLPLMTRNRDEHTQLATFSSIGNNLVGLIAGMAITPIVLAYGWKFCSVLFGIISAILILISALSNKEVESVEETAKGAKVPMREQLSGVLKNRYFYLLLLLGIFTLVVNANAIGAQIYYCNIVLGNPGFMSVLMGAGQLPGLLIMFIMPWFAKHFSKRNFMVMGAVLMIIDFAVSGLAGSNMAMLIVGTVIRSAGIGPMFGGFYALIPDVVEYGNMKSGIRSEGLISSAQSIGSKVGIGIGSALTGWILAGVGYNAAAEPTAAVASAITFDYTWLGAIISIVLLIICLAFNVEKYESQFDHPVEEKA